MIASMNLRRRLVSKEALYTMAPLVIAAGFAAAAHAGFLGPSNSSTVTVIAKAEPGTSIEVQAGDVVVKHKAKKAQKRKAGARDPYRLGAKVYRAQETHWVPRLVVERLFEDPSLLEVYGDFVTVRRCRSIDGYRIENILPNALLRRLGFRNGDYITAVDGQRFGRPQHARQLLQSLQFSDQITVTVVRGGHTLQKTFLIEED